MKFNVLAVAAFCDLTFEETVDTVSSVAQVVAKAVIVCSEPKATGEEDFAALLDLAAALPFKSELVACRAIIVNCLEAKA